MSRKDDSGTPPKLHPIVQDAAHGILPSWSCMTPSRLAHVHRVADLLDTWAVARRESETERMRWRAAGMLHDVLKDRRPAKLRAYVGKKHSRLPASLLHGPAAARKLKREGVRDPHLLRAIRYHTIGSPKFSTIGLALYAADFLEPGRSIRPKWRKRLRKMAETDLVGVVRDVAEARVMHQVRRGRPLRSETVGLWNRLSGGKDWSGASEG